MGHNFRIHVNCGVETSFLFILELDLLFIDSNAIWSSDEVLIVVLSVYLVPVVARGSASFDAEPLTEVSTLG